MKSSENPQQSAKNVCALILCAGSGTRAKLGYNKLLYYIGKKTLLETTLDGFMQSYVDSIVLVIHPDDEAAAKEITAEYPIVQIVYGGATRTESVRCGLQAVQNCDIVVIHDGARPYVTPALINKTILSATQYGSGIAAVPAVDTVKTAENGQITGSLPREKLWCMQTPQTFDYAKIIAAYDAVKGNYTDDAEVYALAGNTPRIVEGEYDNIKVTTASDLFRGAPKRTKIGTGFDVHPFAKGRKLILGGVEIAHPKGLTGHSDADALVHAVMDALLSAAGLPDIGVLFPDTDKATEGIDSLQLLDTVYEEIRKIGYSVGNLSAVIMAQAPKMAPHIAAMRQTIAKHLHILPEQIDISATTTERLGIIGEEKGIAASATCLLFY